MQEAKIITRWIGIDPGATAGFALWDANQSRLLYLKSFSFFPLLHHLLKQKEEFEKQNINFAVRIEDPRGNAPTFDDHPGDDSRRIHAHISQSVGANKRDAGLIAEFCELHDIIHFLVRPGKKSLTKIKAEEFNRRFQWQGGGDQHARDAAGLVVYQQVMKIRPDQAPKKGPAVRFLPG